MISAALLTKNEEKNIKKCLEKLSWVDEIIVVDDFSSDSTIDCINKLKKKNIRVYKRHLNNDFSGQRNFALSKVKDKNSWVLFVDCDEIITPELRSEIRQKIKEERYEGFLLKRKDFFMKRELKHGETGNNKFLRLAKNGSGKWRREVHEKWNIKGRIGELNNPILHDQDETLHELIEKINFYSELHAKSLKMEKEKSNLIKIIVWPTGKFIYNYVFRLGFLDGIPGFILAIIMSFHSFLSWSKLWMD